MEALLRCPVQQIGWPTGQEVVARRLPEDQSLEFKSEPYGRNNASKQELCKDVAGMANAGGGLIIIGIEEDESSAAESIAPIASSDDEVTRLTQTVLSGIEPMVPDLAVWEDGDPTTDDRLLFILVPESTGTPHAVRRDDVYAWPVRHDRATRWMREPELAAAYRERFRTADDVTARVAEVHGAGTRALNESGRCWLTLATAPRRPGRLPADRDSYRDWLSGAMHDLPFAISTATAVLGRQRIVFTDQFPYGGSSKDHHLELHADGSGFAGLVVTQRGGVDSTRVPMGQALAFDTDSITYTVPSLLAVLARHAARAGGGGELALVAQLVGRSGDISALLTLEGTPLLPTEPYTDPSGEYAASRVVPGSMPVKRPTPFELTAPVSVGWDHGALVSSSAELTHELIAEFGSSVSEPVLRTDGRIQYRDFEGALGPLFSWARAHKLLLELSNQ